MNYNDAVRLKSMLDEKYVGSKYTYGGDQFTIDQVEIWYSDRREWPMFLNVIRGDIDMEIQDSGEELSVFLISFVGGDLLYLDYMQLTDPLR